MRYYYSDLIETFVDTPSESILGQLAAGNQFSLEPAQRDSWQYEIVLLQSVLRSYKHRGKIFFEFTIPRLGKRVDVVVLIDSLVFVLEFKVGESIYSSYGHDQVWDYALDLKNFHETSHHRLLIPILIATKAIEAGACAFRVDDDNLMAPLHCNEDTLAEVVDRVVESWASTFDPDDTWASGRYRPTPTIIEAAMALYKGHNVEEISRSDASAVNLSVTSDLISRIIATSRENSQKSICFVTGVPGAGKTLVGLNIATKHIDAKSELHSVFLSGNSPLVAVLCEALTRDRVQIAKEQGQRLRKGKVKSEVQLFIQNIHHFRDDCLASDGPPIEPNTSSCSTKRNEPGIWIKRPVS